MEVQKYVPPTIANPGNLIHTLAGGGNMGHPLAHENEAPFPEDLAEWFLRPLCPPGGRVLDPFSGSGTTVAVAERLGRVGIGLDLRQSQCELVQVSHRRHRVTLPGRSRRGATSRHAHDSSQLTDDPSRPRVAPGVSLGRVNL